MRALIVGAGAVGQVYGLALQRAGVDVSFYVKPAYVEEARAGYTLYALNGGPTTIRFEGFGVLSTPEEVAAAPWDQLWLATSATAIQGAWVEALVAATGDATVVCLQPGPESVARLKPVVGERMVMGIIAMVSYQAPLPRETRFTVPGVAFWFPPTGSPFAGPDARVAPVVDALVRGGCPARRSPPLAATSVFGAALLQVHVAALDAVGWSWTRVTQGDTLALAARAWREAAAVGALVTGGKVPFWAALVGPLASKIAMAGARRLIPLDLPTYFAYHFTKVGDQTRANLDYWISRGDDGGLPVSSLKELRSRMATVATFDPTVDLG